MTKIDKVFKNQLGIFRPDQFEEFGVTIIGCGSLGSFMAITLAKMGVTEFELWDPDTIEEHNLTTQFFDKSALKKSKASVVRDLIIAQSPYIEADLRITTHKQRFDADSQVTTPIVITCPDNITTREVVYDVAKNSEHVKLMIDLRMGGIVFKIFTIDLTSNTTWYEETLHSEEDADRGPCTEKGIIFNVLGCCSFAASQLKKIFKNEPYDKELNFGYDTMEVMRITHS